MDGSLGFGWLSLSPSAGTRAESTDAEEKEGGGFECQEPPCVKNRFGVLTLKGEPVDARLPVRGGVSVAYHTKRSRSTK